MDESVESLRELLTLDELTNRVGMSVRNVRFYTTKGLVPPPIRRGRSGYYSADHVARLELVQELQAHGFTLSAIEKYVAGIPADATPEDIALHRTMLAPVAGRPAGRDVARRARQAHRPHPQRRRPRHAGRPRHRASAPSAAATRSRSPSSPSASACSTSGFPIEAAIAAADVYAEHGRQIAKELNELFRTMVWPVYKESGASPDTLREVVERLKPLSIASLVSAYEAAMDETRRENIEKRAAGLTPARMRAPRDGYATLTHEHCPVTGASGFVGSRLVPALLDRGLAVKAMTRHPESYDGPGEPVAGDVSDPPSLTGPLEGVDVAVYLVHSLDDDDFESKDAEAARAFGRAAAAQRGPADRLPRRAREGRRRALGAPALPARGRAAARRGRRAGDRAACRDRGRRRRHLVGDHPAAREEPARDGRAEVGRDPHPADRARRRGALPRRRGRRRGGVREDLRDRRPGPAQLRGDAPAGSRGDPRAPGADPDGAGADAASSRRTGSRS